MQYLNGLQKKEQGKWHVGSLLAAAVFGIAVLAAVLVLQGHRGGDPHALLNGIKLVKGMEIAEVRRQLGEPDSYDDGYGYGGSGPILNSRQTSSYPCHIEEIGYGPFGAYNLRVGHTTRYRLRMTFLDGKLLEWMRSAPIQAE